VNPFDELARLYDAWYQEPPGSVAGGLEREILLRMAQPRPGMCALEVGVGTGYFAQVVAETGAQVVGVDISMPMLREAARKDSPAALLRGDTLALPFDDGTFDLVYAITMLEFVPQAGQAIAEMWRVGTGRLVIGVLNRWSPWARRKAPPFDQAHYYSPPELCRLLAPYGRVRWGSSVIFLPGGRLLRWARLLEWLGRGPLRPFGALLMASVTPLSSEERGRG